MPPVRGPKTPPLLDRRLSSAADLTGDADGVASKEELTELAAELATRPHAEFDDDAPSRALRARVLASSAPDGGVATLDPVLAALPSPVRRLALQLDALWGDADGALTLGEIDRVASYYLSAVAFFQDDAQRLLDLAGRLGIQTDRPLPESGNLVALRAATAETTPHEVASARPFRALLDEAVAAADVPGAPELLRDADLHSPTYHHLSILDHTTTAVRAMDDLLEHMDVDWPDAPAVMLLHDVGKVLDRVSRPDRGDNHFSYWDHEEAGARWLEARGIGGEMAWHVRHHMILRPSSAREIRAYAGGDKRRLARILLVYCADDVGKGNTPAGAASFREQRDKILALAAECGLDGPRLVARAEELKARWFADVPLPRAPD